MPRVRLTDAERLARKRERVRRMISGEAYAQYDDSLGRGSPEEWAAQAEAFARGHTTLAIPINADLATLKLDAMPMTKAVLYAAFRKAALSAHPDTGGSDALFIAVKEAYGRLALKFKEG